MKTEYEYLIVGGGQTADAAAGQLRKQKPDARIGILGDEPTGPYKRPPLTKGAWNPDSENAPSISLDTAVRNVDVHVDRHVTALDPGARKVTDSQGDEWHYGKLLLATGSTPRMIDALPPHDRIIYYRTLENFRHLRRLAVAGSRIGVIGSGFIGSELAASLTGAGCRVTMIFPEELIGAGRFPVALSDFISMYYEDKGVELVNGVSVARGQGSDDGATVELSDGRTLEFDAVVAGLGVTPNVELAEKADLKVDDGVVVDSHLLTSDPHIYAAGDIASFYNPALDRRLRVEHENAAISMGGMAGRNMAGSDESYDTLPFFYSDLFDLGYEAVGDLDDSLQVYEVWRVPYGEGVVYYHDGDRVRGVLLWNVWGQVDAARQLIASPGPVDEESLRHKIMF